MTKMARPFRRGESRQARRLPYFELRHSIFCGSASSFSRRAGFPTCHPWSGSPSGETGMVQSPRWVDRAIVIVIAVLVSGLFVLRPRGTHCPPVDEHDISNTEYRMTKVARPSRSRQAGRLHYFGLRYWIFDILRFCVVVYGSRRPHIPLILFRISTSVRTSSAASSSPLASSVCCSSRPSMGGGRKRVSWA